MKQNIQLLIIDPQNDFCDLPAAWLPLDPVTGETISPSLPVAGAHGDMLRLASFIEGAAPGLSSIAITLDSHYRFDVAHPTFWQARGGQPVPSFTQITAAQVRDGAYAPKDAAALPRVLAYLDALESRGRYTLMVWPVHCEMGSWGHNVHAAVKAACNAWEDTQLMMARKIAKGSNPWTEHYSALQAEVPDAADPSTQLNTSLLADLDGADLILVAGEASSHCVRATVEDLVANLPSRDPKKVVLLTDCISPVGGFDAQHHAFLDGMRAAGVRLSTSVEMLLPVRDNAV
ncbi:MAG: cysteine hydrolase [Comamonadaceae bacterium]|nr:MAG: cysteine hydrolase [Comamonadaceae bacterium]